MKQTVTYYLFGIPIWRVTRNVTVEDREELFQEFCARLNESLTKARSGA